MSKVFRLRLKTKASKYKFEAKAKGQSYMKTYQTSEIIPIYSFIHQHLQRAFFSIYQGRITGLKPSLVFLKIMQRF